MNSVTLYKINDMIRNLYDDRIPVYTRLINFFHNIYEIIYYDRCTILFFQYDENKIPSKHSSVSLNWKALPTPLERYSEYYIQLDDILPVLSEDDNPIIFRCSSFFDLKKRKETEYYRDFLLPNNCIYSIDGNLKIKSDSGLKAVFSFYRGGEKRDFNDDELEIVKLFQPHLSQVLRYYDNEEPANIVFMLDKYNCMASVLLDSSFRMVRCSNLYKQLSSSISNGQLDEKVIEACMAMKNCGADINNCTYEYKVNKAPYYIEISRIQSDFESNSPHYLCLVYDLSKFFSGTINQAKSQYMLTEREFEILQLIIKGKSVEEISSMLYLSISSVKKYLSSIYDKLQVKNQKQIFEKLNLT